MYTNLFNFSIFEIIDGCQIIKLAEQNFFPDNFYFVNGMKMNLKLLDPEIFFIFVIRTDDLFKCCLFNYCSNDVAVISKAAVYHLKILIDRQQNSDR